MMIFYFREPCNNGVVRFNLHVNRTLSKRDLSTMSILSKILNFFKPKTNSGITDQMKESIDTFRNRPIYKILSQEIINKTSDDDLIQVVFDNLCEKFPSEFQNELEVVKTWNQCRQAIYTIWVLEAEVNNGGFNQFFENSSGQFSKYLPELLSQIGAKNFAILMQNAIETYESERLHERQDGTLEGFSKSYEDNPLDEFDSKFYELYKTENLQELQIEYIKNNSLHFIDA